eukprot:jgi/Hompol1/2478/HPOL_000097-RA
MSFAAAAASSVRRTTTAAFSPVARLSALRTKTSLIPPNVASLKEIGRLQSAFPQAHPEIFARMRNFYKVVPKGNAPVSNPTTFWGQYYKHYVETDTLYPILHFMAIMVPVGYYLQYFVAGTTPLASSINLMVGTHIIWLSAQ